MKKQVEEQPREGEMQLRAILESVADGILVVDNNGKVINVNQRFADLWRIPPRCMERKDDCQLLDFVLSQLRDPSAFLRKVQSLYSTDAADMDTIAFKDGRLFERYSCPMIMKGTRIGRVWSFRDITERTRAEQFRSLSITILAILNKPSSLRDMITGILSAVKKATNFDAVGIRLQSGNDFPYFAQEGFSEDFLLKENTLLGAGKDGVACRDKDGNINLECTCGLVISGKTDPANPLFTSGGSCWTNNSFTLADLSSDQDPRFHPRNRCMHAGYGSVALIPIRENQKIVGLLQLNNRKTDSLTLDMVRFFEGITASIGVVLTQKRNAESLKLKNFVFEESMAANSIANLEGVITEVNEMHLRIWGYPCKDEVVGQPLQNFLNDPNELVAIIATLNKVGQWEGFYTAKRKDGSTFSAYGLATVVRNEHGECIGYQSSVMDVSERIRAEAEIRKSQKLASIGTLAGGIAHDFNNILMGLLGTISLAKEELPADHPGYKLLEKTNASMNRAIVLTKQLLTFAKGGEPVKELVNLGALIEETAARELSGSNVTLVYEQTDDLWPVVADKEQMGPVISSIILNARQAMPKGGHLYITMVNANIPESDFVSLPQGKYIKVTVRDEGEGINQKHLDRIFEPYFTTKTTGHGLGLAIAYSIIDKHGGLINVVPGVDRGATFTIYLPVSEFSQGPGGKPPAAERRPLSKPARILIMDDEKAILYVVSAFLARAGFVTATAPGGQEAIEMYKQALNNGKPFDVVIMDLTISGGIGGKDAIKALREIDPQVRAIVSSGYADDPVMANYAEYGFEGALTKPYVQGELHAVLGQVLGRTGSSL